MGVRWLWQFRVSDVRSELQQLATRVTETCGGYLSGKWAAQVDLAFRNVPQQAPRKPGQAAVAPTPASSTPDSDMFRIRLSGEEQNTYLVMGNSVCECGQGIDALMHTLAAFQTKLTTMYEGDEYVVGDFIIRIGSVRIAKQFQNAVVVDIEYTACFYLDDCYSLLGELMSNLACSQNNVLAVLNGVKRINFKECGLTNLYTPKHTSLQYVQAAKQITEITMR